MGKAPKLPVKGCIFVTVWYNKWRIDGNKFVTSKEFYVLRKIKDISFITTDGYKTLEQLSIKSKKSIKKTKTFKKKLKRFLKRAGKDISIAASKAVDNVNAVKGVKTFFKTLLSSEKTGKSVARFSVPAVATVLSALICFGVTSHLNANASAEESTDTVILTNAVLQTANDVVSGGFEKAIEQTSLPQTQMLEVADEVSDKNALFGLYIDGVLVGSMSDKDEINNIVDKLVAQYSEVNGENVQAELISEVKVIQGSYGEDFVLTAEQLANKAADKIKVSATADVKTTKSIDFETEYRYDDSEYDDYEEVTQKGENGVFTTVKRVSYINGEEVASNLVSEGETKSAVNQIITIGTKERPAKGYSAGSFTWPVPYTTSITSPFGPRWGTFHYGIDISDSGIHGQDIVASDGGTVTWAGYDSSGYGYYVIIDHGNGYETLYGHCSELYVSDGQEVAQGDLIAAVGSTGDSTGAHLHFEISCGGERLDPESFV